MILIKGGRIINPADGTDRIGDVLISRGRIEKIAEYIHENEAEIIDAAGMIVAPGLVDVHVHFRDPGFTYKEDIVTGAKAAAKGGFTTVVLMANTNPPVDNAETLQYVLEKGKSTGIHVESCANVTVGMQGREIVNMEALSAAGAAGFTDDGIPLLKEEIVREAMVQAKRAGKLISFHEENPAYIKNNGIHAGEAARYYGIGGSQREAEVDMVRRDLALAAETGARISIQHVSTREAVELIRQAKLEHHNIFAEATPHHFTLTEEAIVRYGTLAKMNPPLRTEDDRLAIIHGLQDGTIDMIATDHAPHSREEKDRSITEAPSGIVGLETALSLGIRELVEKGYLTMPELIGKMSSTPARIYGLDRGYLAEGGPADLVLFCQEELWKVDRLVSKSDNSPFLGEEMPGVVYVTICNGKVVYRLGEEQ